MLRYALNALYVFAFLAGWFINGWYHDSLQLVADKAAASVAEQAASNQFKQAEVLADTLKRLRANERTIYKESVKLVDRPVYSNICADADGLRLINAAKNGNPTVSP